MNVFRVYGADTLPRHSVLVSSSFGDLSPRKNIRHGTLTPCPTYFHGMVKVNMSLCFSLNREPRYEGILGSGCIASSILDLGSRWM
jgi:hypothetical protein